MDIKTIIDIGKTQNRTRIFSNVGNTSRDIIIDFNGVSLSNSGQNPQDQITVVTAVSQNQTSGVGANVGMFICSPDLEFGFTPTGLIPKEKLGTLVSFDGSSNSNWGSLSSFVTFFPIVLPARWFLRFCTFQNIGFAGNGDFFQIDICYYLIKCS